MVQAVKLGQTALDMLAAGSKDQLVVRVRSIIQMEMYLRATFAVTKRMEKAATLMLTGKNTKVTGLMIFNMELVSNYSKMALSTVENSETARNTG